MKNMVQSSLQVVFLSVLAAALFLVSVFHVKTGSGSKNFTDQTDSVRGQFALNYAFADVVNPPGSPEGSGCESSEPESSEPESC